MDMDLLLVAIFYLLLWVIAGALIAVACAAFGAPKWVALIIIALYATSGSR